MEWMSAAFSADVMGQPAWVWLLFVGVVLTLLVLDLGVLQKRMRAIGVRQSLLLSAFYIGAGLLFGVWVWFSLGAESGMEYLTGFFIEKSLSLDNVFVISLIFGFFAVPARHSAWIAGRLAAMLAPVSQTPSASKPADSVAPAASAAVRRSCRE